MSKKTLNPKDALAHKKVPIGLLPSAGIIYGALAMQHGAEKYGPYNWRETEVALTIYLDAIRRHTLPVLDGQWLDPDSGLPHLGAVIATASIILDANGCGTLVNDLPLPGPAAAILEKYTVKK